MGASPRERKALVEAMGVESNYRHLDYGDRDSVGVLQQRPSQGWGPAGESVEKDVAQFLKAARRANKGGGSAGQLAQAVQRSAFPERYDRRSGEAEQLLRSVGGGGGGSRGSSGGTAPTARTRTEATFDEDAYKQAQQKQVLAALLEKRRGPKGSVLLRTGAISSAPVDPAAFQGERQVTERVPSRRSSGSGSGGRATGGSPLFELFHDPIGGYKHGKSIGPIGGHGGHVHVAAGPKTVIRLGKLAEEKYGLTVRENPHWDKVDPVHTKGSYHYSRRAIDVSGDPKAMRRYARDVLRQYGSKR